MALAADCDAPEPPLIDLVSENMSGASMLPFVFFVDAQGQWLAGLSGFVEPGAFQQQLEALIA